MKKELTYVTPSWNHMFELCMQLAQRIKEDDFHPDMLLGICRGGWPPARILSDLLDNPNLASMKVEFYTDINKTVEEPVITQPLCVDVKDKRVLVIDDVADSGKSLKLVKDDLLRHGAKEVKICTVYYKPWSIIKPDYHALETESWIIFPHEVRESIRKIGEKLSKEGKDPKEIKAALIKIGLKPLTVNSLVDEIFSRREGRSKTES